ncbi:MAG TPA: sigma-54 dependent transcriptional regulator [Bryobacteraceae bacterium]|nr:sigma-54 dependent transcriptional regulator [Bryobacteraceae bacterium]
MPLLGRSQRVIQIRSQLAKLSENRTPVLLQGESGTGKEVAARELFDNAPRGHFVPIDCGSLVGPLMESELFGHTKGAFTGAGEAKRGLLELANGGTAFFDEIGDLPLEMQVKLLRVLQEREFRPVGSLQRIRVDIRVVAATHRDLQREVAAGRFREDLFHRLNVVRITLPPLRERKEDIPMLVDRFLSMSGRRYVIAAEAMEGIQRYDWPGNVRELKNCMDRMMAFNSGPVLHFSDLPTNVMNGWRPEGAQIRTMAAAVGSAGGAVLPLQEVERRAIEQALAYTRGDRSMAAHLLGIGRTTLYRKLKEYGHPPAHGAETADTPRA